MQSIDPRIHRVALRKLRQVGSAESLEDPRVPHVNRLETLTGDRVGRHSVRIDEQWRICFVRTDAGSHYELDRAEHLAGDQIAAITALRVA